MIKLSPLLVISLTSTLFANTPTSLKTVEKIKVYNVPFSKTFAITGDNVTRFIKNEIPSDLKKRQSKSSDYLFHSADGNMMLVIKNKKSHVQNYNNMLKVVQEYARKNIPNTNEERMSSMFSLLKLKDTSLFNAEQSSNTFASVKSSTREKLLRDVVNNTDTTLDFTQLTVNELLEYFIGNYQSINLESPPSFEEDIRLQLVTEIKKQLRSNSSVDSDWIEYDISLEELKQLETLI